MTDPIPVSRSETACDLAALQGEYASKSVLSLCRLLEALLAAAEEYETATVRFGS